MKRGLSVVGALVVLSGTLVHPQTPSSSRRLAGTTVGGRLSWDSTASAETNSN